MNRLESSMKLDPMSKPASRLSGKFHCFYAGYIQGIAVMQLKEMLDESQILVHPNRAEGDEGEAYSK